MYGIVELDSFSNLKYLTYGTRTKDTVLPYAIRQLGAITSKSNLTQINFDLSLDHKNQPDEETDRGCSMAGTGFYEEPGLHSLAAPRFSNILLIRC